MPHHIWLWPTAITINCKPEKPGELLAETNVG